MSEQRSPVHAAHTTAWKPMEFLSLSVPTGHFSTQEFRSQIEQGFHRARIEAMPDNSLRAPARWTPPSPGGATSAPDASARAPAATPDAAASTLGLEQIDRIRSEAFEEGLAQGRSEGEANAQARLQSQQQNTRDAQLHALQDMLGRIEGAVSALRQQPDSLYEPLKRLALHLAEELVLGELQIGAQAIDRLVQRCVDEMQAAQNAHVCIELNPQDLQALQAQPELESDRPDAWRWQAVETLLPGSVRVRVDDAVVTDLIEHRLQSLAQSLLGQPQRWADQTALRSDRLADRFGKEPAVSDVQPRAPLSDMTEMVPPPAALDLPEDLGND